MAERAVRCDPELWDRVKADITDGDKGGHRGQWSARKAQMAVQEYKKRGGTYASGKKGDDNALKQWTEEEWGTRSGRRSRDSGERYLPRKAREALSQEEYDRSSAKKREDTRCGRQFSGQPADVREKTAKHRRGGVANATKAELYRIAKERELPGRSKMSKAELAAAIGG